MHQGRGRQSVEAKQLLSQSRSQLSTLKRPQCCVCAAGKNNTQYFHLLLSYHNHQSVNVLNLDTFCLIFASLSMIVFVVLISIFEITKIQGQDQDGTTRPFPSEQR